MWDAPEGGAPTTHGRACPEVSSGPTPPSRRLFGGLRVTEAEVGLGLGTKCPCGTQVMMKFPNGLRE